MNVKIKTREIIGYGICIIILVWIVLSTLEIWKHSLDVGYVYTKANCWVMITQHTTDMKVVDCKGNPDDSYTVTVEDIEGNLWEYYDTEPKETETIMEITMSGNQIINATER